MEDNAMRKRMLKGRLYSKRRKWRPRMRWLDDVESDLKKMEVKGWKEKMRDREQWRLVVEEARAVVPNGWQASFSGSLILPMMYISICSVINRFPYWHLRLERNGLRGRRCTCLMMLTYSLTNSWGAVYGKLKWSGNPPPFHPLRNPKVH
jgi:hypothetical protein